MGSLIFGLFYLLWQLIKWLWKWLFAPCIVLGIFAIGIQLVSMIPIFGTLLHGLIVVFSFFNIAQVTQSTPMLILLYVALPLALLDCINDLRITVRYRLYRADDALMLKYNCCAFLSAIGAVVFYYMSDKSFQGVIQSIVSNYNILLLLTVLPRALFIFVEIYSEINVKDLIKSNNFFTIRDTSGNSSVLKSKYVKLRQNAGFVVSNKSIIEDEKRISSGKLEQMYPKKFLAKAAEFLVGDKETIAKRERAERELAEMEKRVSYISKEGFKNFSARAEELLRQVSSMSPRDIIEMKFPQYRRFPGVEFFLIEAFDSGVKTGKIEDESKDDYPMENHAYRHTESSVKVLSRNGNKELALDDDD
jgi:hypothetical protein